MNAHDRKSKTPHSLPLPLPRSLSLSISPKIYHHHRQQPLNQSMAESLPITPPKSPPWTEREELNLLNAVLEIASEPPESYDPRINLFGRINKNTERSYTDREILDKIKELRDRFEKRRWMRESGNEAVMTTEAFAISEKIWGKGTEMMKTAEYLSNLGQPVMVKPSEAEKNLVQSTATGGSGVAGAAAARKIYVGNLHFNITEDQLRQVFEPFGPVELVQLPLDLETGQCKGYGFLQFTQIEHAKAAQSLNGMLEIAERIIKVSAVTDHVTAPEPGANSGDFDDNDGGGVSLNAHSRALIMQKLDRTGTASSIAESLGVPLVNGVAQPNPQVLHMLANGQAMLSTAPALLTPSLPVPIGEPSECILLKNMFDPRTETDPDFDLDIRDDVQEECTKFGPLKHIYVDKHSEGHVYLRFESVTAATSCQRAMHMRWFAGRAIHATFMRPYEYDAKFVVGG